MKEKYKNKQGWQDAKARSQGYKNEQERRGNSGERYLANNPDYVAPSTTPFNKKTGASNNTGSQASSSTQQSSASTAPTQNSQALNNEHSPKANDVGAQAKPASNNFNLSSDPNDSYEDIQKKYQAIYRNEKLYGVAEGRDVYAEAGLRNPSFLYSTNSRKEFKEKYGGDIQDAFRAMGYHDDGYGNGWHKPDTLDKATFNLDPDGYGKENPNMFGSGKDGYNPNNEQFRATYDYSTETPVMRNTTTDGVHARNLEKRMGSSIEDMNKKINPNSGIDYSKGLATRQGEDDYQLYRRASQTYAQNPDSRRDKGFIDRLHKSGNYGQGFFEKMANNPLQNLYDPHGHFANFDFTPYKKGGSKYSGRY